ncbi:hypothetical protein Bca4012_052257 [Brassica carinata]
MGKHEEKGHRLEDGPGRGKPGRTGPRCGIAPEKSAETDHPADGNRRQHQSAESDQRVRGGCCRPRACTADEGRPWNSIRETEFYRDGPRTMGAGEKHVRLCQRNSWSKMIQPVERRIPCVEIAGCRGDCTRPRDLQGTETFVLGSLFDRSRGTKISVLGRVFSGKIVVHLQQTVLSSHDAANALCYKSLVSSLSRSLVNLPRRLRSL